MKEKTFCKIVFSSALLFGLFSPCESPQKNSKSYQLESTPSSQPSSSPTEFLEESARKEFVRRNYIKSHPPYQERNYAIINEETFELINRK